MLTNSRHCLCGIHVRRGAFAIGIVFLIITALVFATMLFNLVREINKGGSYNNVIGLIVYGIAFISCILLLVGNRIRNRFLYWPFLIINYIYCAIYVVFSVLFFAFSVLIVIQYLLGKATSKPAWVHGDPFVLLIGSILMLIVTFIYLYLITVANRDYNLMKAGDDLDVNYVVHTHERSPKNIVVQRV